MDKFESKLQYDFKSLPSGIIGFQNIDLPNKEHAALYEKYPETTGKFCLCMDSRGNKRKRSENSISDKKKEGTEGSGTEGSGTKACGNIY